MVGVFSNNVVVSQTSDKLCGHNSYMQVIFCMMHKQDSKSVQMNKCFHGLSKEGKTWEGTPKQ